MHYSHSTVWLRCACAHTNGYKWKENLGILSSIVGIKEQKAVNKGTVKSCGTREVAYTKYTWGHLIANSVYITITEIEIKCPVIYL